MRAWRMKEDDGSGIGNGGGNGDEEMMMVMIDSLEKSRGLIQLMKHILKVPMWDVDGRWKRWMQDL